MSTDALQHAKRIARDLNAAMDGIIDGRAGYRSVRAHDSGLSLAWHASVLRTGWRAGYGVELSFPDE